MSFSHKDKEELCKKLWLEYKDVVNRLCRYKLSGYPNEIDDVVSETFYYLCREIFSGKNITNPENWLLVVANNLIKKKYNEIRRVKLRQVSLDDFNFENFYIEENELWEKYLSKNILDKLEKIVFSELTLEEQTLYRYIYMDNKKAKEVANLLNLTEVNVRQRNFRLRKKLKKLMQKNIEDI